MHFSVGHISTDKVHWYSKWQPLKGSLWVHWWFSDAPNFNRSIPILSPESGFLTVSSDLKKCRRPLSKVKPGNLQSSVPVEYSWVTHVRVKPYFIQWLPCHENMKGLLKKRMPWCIKDWHRIFNMASLCSQRTLKQRSLNESSLETLHGDLRPFECYTYSKRRQLRHISPS